MTEERPPEVLYRDGKAWGVDLVCAGFHYRLVSPDSQFPVFSYKYRYELNRERVSADDYEVVRPRLPAIVPLELLDRWDAHFRGRKKANGCEPAGET